MKNFDDIIKKSSLKALNGRNIIYCKADGSYTKVFFSYGKSTLLSYRISLIQKALDTENFIRCHKSFLVNRHCIKEICSKSRIFVLSNDHKVSISRRFKKEVEKILLKHDDVVSLN